ncbi:hypothetical protein [Citrobacter sp. MGH105]|nr:hypothetical protein [Citrobacter sp. MGH105]
MEHYVRSRLANEIS